MSARTSPSPSTSSDMILVVIGGVAIGAAILAWGVSALALEVGAFLERGHWIDVAGWGPLLAYGNVQKPGVDLATAAAQHDAPNEGMWLFLVVIFGVIAVGGAGRRFDGCDALDGAWPEAGLRHAGRAVGRDVSRGGAA